MRRRDGFACTAALFLLAMGGTSLAQTSESTAGVPAPEAAAPQARSSLPPVEPVRLRRGAPPPPPPTAEQLKAFEILQREAREYERGAKDYRKTLTMIVRHHYEERRRRVLATLDRQIGREKKTLVTARDEAIARLEAFIARYSGPKAQPKATPDAMFRLAALYEERGREQWQGETAEGLEPAIVLYVRIIEEFPAYEEIAAVHYYLGHALTDSGRLAEGQQAFRSLVCHNRFRVQVTPSDRGTIAYQPLPQDHDQKYWANWYNRHPVPIDQATRGGRRQAGTPDDEISYKEVYPDCQPLPQLVEAGKEPRYLAEVWWQIGNYHFDQIDTPAGPYHLNRAVSAYQRGMEYKKPPIYGVSLYKLAWAYFKQQRYRTGVEEFVRLLHYADEQEAQTGDPGADFRAEAYTYIAGSLSYVDFEGPPADAPYIPRSDVLDLELDPLRAEQRMAVAIERVQNPKLIPQDRKWSVEIYKALAQEYIELSQNRNAIATLELTLQKFPMDRDAPIMQNRVADLYDQLSQLSTQASAAREEYGAKALAARTKLAAYVGATPWTNANRDDPEALQQAEQLVRVGLKRAAADHTNFARAFYGRALELNDEGEQRDLIDKSLSEYRLAETGWTAYLGQDPTALDSYDTKFWLADARYWIVVLQVTLARSPSELEVAAARMAAEDVRDSNDDDRFLQPASYYLVSLADKLVEDEYRLHETTSGARGFARREAVQFVGEGDERRVVVDPLPQPVLDAARAREDYVARVPTDQDPLRNGPLYAFQVADTFFVYGRFDEARKRFLPLYEQYCGQNDWGYKAWEKLISMSNFEGNAEESRKLAEGKSCAFNEETRIAEEGIRKPVRQGVAYLDARKVYEEAEQMPDGPERSRKWREAAAAYKVALDAAPDRDEAPEAAMNGAYAYKQVGEYDKAIEMYELFISRYGNPDMLGKLRDGDPKAKPPVEPKRAKFEERTKYLKSANDALAGAYVLFFNYPKAAAVFDRISETTHFKPEERRESARQALALYASLGDMGGMTRARQRLGRLGASGEEIAEADFVVASAELKKWDELSPPEGANGNARRKAMGVMEEYYKANRNKDAAAQYLVQAAYWVAKARKAVRAPDTNEWWRSTVSSFERWRRLAPRKDGRSVALGSREAGMAAEAEFTMLDEEIQKKFDYEAGHHRFKGTPAEVIRDYQKQAAEAQRWYEKLQHVMDAYLSPEWTMAAVARQGSLYDSLRTGLYNTRPPALVMFDKKQEAMLRRAEESDNPDLQERADAVRVNVQQTWRDRRDQEIDGADRIMVDRYATAIVLARRYNVSSTAVTRAIRRLAFSTDIIGEAKMREYTSGVKDLGYTEAMFPKMRPGLVTAPKSEGMPAPLPVSAP